MQTFEAAWLGSAFTIEGDRTLVHGELRRGVDFACSLADIMGELKIEVVSGPDPEGWILAIVLDRLHGGEIGRIRANRSLGDPCLGMQILLPNRPGVDVGSTSFLGRIVSDLSLRFEIPTPFDTALELTNGALVFKAQWEACADPSLDALVMGLAAFRFWLGGKPGANRGIF